jgi:hypothetical protein
MQISRLSSVAICLMFAALFPVRAWGFDGSLSYNIGSFTSRVAGNSFPSISSQNFSVPQWDPNANPGRQLMLAGIMRSVSYSASASLSANAPTGTGFYNPYYTFVTPQFQDPWNITTSDIYAVPNGTTVPATFQLPLTSLGSFNADGSIGPSFTSLYGGSFLGTGTLSYPADLNMTVTHGPGGDQYTIASLSNQSFTESAQVIYFYNNVPEPASCGIVVAAAGFFLSRRRLR